ncbi:MAG: hypothetical protein PHI18_07260 [bacterium]|nr:hypothetical protein [bacterium]
MPNTPHGKARSRMNAFKHGLSATDDLFVAHLRHRERAVFEEFRSSLHREYKPQTDQEKLLVDRIAIQYFRLFRLYHLEDTAVRETISSVSSNGSRTIGSVASIIPHLDRFARYDWRIGRQIRNLHNHLGTLFIQRGERSFKMFVINE